MDINETREEHAWLSRICTWWWVLEAHPAAKWSNTSGRRGTGSGRSPATAGDVGTPGVELVASDVTDQGSLDAACHGVERRALRDAAHRTLAARLPGP